MIGRICILSGPSGVGKDTVIDAWVRRNPRVQRVVAYTTRNPREGEVHDVDYHFVTKARFDELALNGHFLEHKEVHGNHYASPKTDLQRMVEEGKIAILKIDVQGAITAMDVLPHAISVFLLPPSQEALEARLRGRRTDSEASIASRLEGANREMSEGHRYHHRIINESIDQVVEQLEGIFSDRSPFEVL